MRGVLQPNNMLMRPYDPMGSYLLVAGGAMQIIGSLLPRGRRHAATILTANLTPALLIHNLLANSVLFLLYFLIYRLTPFYEDFQVFNRIVHWRLF